jgi:DNA-binding transcriptional MerR regulator
MTNKKIAFNSKFVSNLIGISVNQLHYWDETNLIKPSICRTEGRGSIRLYSYEDLVELKTVVFLKNSNVSIKKIRKAVEYIKNNFPYNRPLKDLTLLSNGIDIIFTEENINSVHSNWLAASNNGQVVMEFVVPIGSIAQNLNDIIAKFNERIAEAEEQKAKGELIPLESIEEEYFGVSNKSGKRSNKRRSA